ncbi:MAG TPA: serine/threonine-protein kinase [Lacunisphaera sp.]|nr:serine/threonine-protein kinase [Lacunisphaera sp.]
MKPDDDIFAEALELPAADRAAFLDRACADAAQRARIEALLTGHDSARSFLEESLGTRPPPGNPEAAGQQIGPYTLVRRLGEGGCGVVWLAEQTTPLRRQVALKIIKLGMDTHSFMARFEAERQALALMNHPDIARVYDAGATETGRPYFVMEYVEGLPITRFCDEHSLAMEARLELFARVCLALQHAHQKGIIHRDLKPSNILVALRDGVPAPKVIDFGIAKATAGRLGQETLFTELGQFLGTPAYMSPEQAEQRDLDLDTRSDVYSLGVLLYELLTGRPPYDPKELVQAGLLEIRRIIREVDPPRPSTLISTLAEADRATVARLRGAAPPRLSAALRGDLDWIVMRCLDKDRDRRYATAAALAEDVRRHLRQDPVEARPPDPAYRLRKFIARNRAACASAGAIAVTLVAGIVTSTHEAVRATRAEQVAAAQRDAAQAAQKAEAAARADAQRRQEQAEDLLTFMLGDFRAELAKIGKLNLLDSVGAKAMAYFAALDPRDLTDTALTRQAKALTQIGEVRLEQARYPEAEEAFTVAYSRAAALAARHAANADMLFERGQAEYWIGYVAHNRGNRTAEREWLVRYRDTALALAALEGQTPRARLEVVYGHHNLAVLDAGAGALDRAREGFLAERTAVDAMLAVQPADSDVLFRRADVSSWLGTVAERNGQYAEAAASFADMRARYAELSRLAPTVARWRFEVARSLMFAAQIEFATGRLESADKMAAQAASMLDALLAQDPANKQRLGVRLGLKLLQANLLFASSGPSAADPVLQEARRGLETLVAAEPSDLVFARRLVFAWRLAARLRLAENCLDDAATAIGHAVTLAEPILRDSRADTAARHECGMAFLVAGHIALARHETEAAKEDWSKALAALGPEVTNSNDWRQLDPAAIALTQAGRAHEARPLVTRLQTFGYVSLDPLHAGILNPAGSTKPPSQKP